MFSRNLMQEFHQAEQESIDQLIEERAYHAGQWITLMRNTEGQLVRFRIGHKRYEAHNLTLEQAITDFSNFRKQRNISFFASTRRPELTTSHEQRLERKTSKV
jgi:hypothetical protein